MDVPTGNVSEKTDYLNEDFSSDVQYLEKISATESIKIEINKGLEDALKELDSLNEKFTKKEGEQLLVLCKNTVIETITGQFGLASMFIDARDGGSSTTPHNFKKGVTSSESDKQKFDSWKSNLEGSFSEQRKGSDYDKNFPKIRKNTFQTQDVIIDDYTGKVLPKDGRAHIDHIVSAKEIEQNAENNLYLSPEDRARMATDPKNRAWTASGANQSKGDQKMEDWLNKKKSGETNEKRFGIDHEKALNKDKEARRHIKRTVTKAAVKKHGKELLATGGKDAVNIAAYSALGAIMRELTQAVFEEIHITFRHRGKETLKEIFLRFKERMGAVLTELKGKWKGILKGSLEAGIVAFLSNIVVFVINLFMTTLKKFVTIIRAGFVSLCQAVKILANPPEGMDSDEVNYQALKVLTTGLIGAGSLGLSVGIEKILQAIPGLQPLMMFPVPLMDGRTVSDILATTLSALAGGLLTTIALYFMDKIHNAGKQDKLQIRLVAQSGVVVQYKVVQTWCMLDDAYFFLHRKIGEGFQLCINTEQEMGHINRQTDSKIDDDYGDVLEDLRKI